MTVFALCERTEFQFSAIKTYSLSHMLTFVYNAEHSGDLGMATKEPWKGRPAAIGRVLLRLVKGLFTLGFYWAPNAECQLPILSIAPGTRPPNERKLPDDYAGLPRDLNSKLRAEAVAKLRADFYLPAICQAAVKHQTKEHRCCSCPSPKAWASMMIYQLAA